MNTHPYVLAFLIITSETIFATVISPSQPYDLTENDVLEIMETAVSLGIETNKPIDNISSRQQLDYGNRIYVDINFKADAKVERGERYISLHCIHSDENWGCSAKKNWWLTVKDNTALRVLAPEDFERHENEYLEVLDFVTDSLGTESRFRRKITMIEKNGANYKISYGNASGGCMEIFVMGRTISNFEITWEITDDYHIC